MRAPVAIAPLVLLAPSPVAAAAPAAYTCDAHRATLIGTSEDDHFVRVPT